MTDIPRPLSGVRVLAAEQVIAGPYGSMLLAAFGADVIRVEHPAGTDLYRIVAPFVENERGHTSAGLMAHNLSKRSLTLDLQNPAGRDLFRRLAATVDVVWENNRPGVMDRLGLGYHALKEINPRIVYVSISGFGQTWSSESPYAERPAYDLIAQAMSGLMLRPGRSDDPPLWAGYALGDQFPAVMAFAGCLLALRQRDLTGQAQHVDIAMYDAASSLLTALFANLGFDPTLVKRGTPMTTAPYGPFRCADGDFVVAVTEHIWPRFCRAIDRPDLLADPTLARGRDRALRIDELRGAIEAWTVGKTRAEVVDTLLAAGVPAGPVQDISELPDCPHLEARGMIVRVDDPVAGERPILGVPIKLAEAPPPRYDPPPQLGQHTAEVLRQELGLTDDEIDRLRQDGVL